MTWLGTVRSTGIDVSQRFGSWLAAMRWLRGLLDATMPEGFYDPAVAKMRAATPDVAWECVSPKHTFQVAPGSMVRR